MDSARRFVDAGGAYFLSHSIGLPVHGYEHSVRAVLGVWEDDPAGAWRRWLAIVDDFRTSLASLLGTSAALVCPQPNVSSALTKVLGSLGSDRLRILLTADAFPSIGFVCRQHGDHDVQMIPSTSDAAAPAVWGEHLRKGVDVVVITHVHSNTGELIPVVDVADVARRHGATVVVDVAQSVGIIPIDVAAWPVDFVVGSCVKWLSGGPGAGWLWAAADRIDRVEPRDVGWFSHEDPFEFDIDDFRYASDARRFWGGTPSVLPFAIARYSIDTIVEVGVEAIRTANQDQIDHLVERFGERVVSPHARRQRGGTCIVEADAELAERLAAVGIFVDHRKNGLRVSPHVHTTKGDVDRLADAVG